MSLYLEHFGLREPPFRITPHTDFFFSGANRGPTLDALIYAITQDEGIVKVTGEVGSGKTMLCRMLLERLPDNVEILYLANPSLSRQEILGAIADELGIPTDGKATHSLTRALQDALIERYAAGKRVVVLIDEAHAMPAESLEEIRLLSNLESKANKLLQIALFAQPELDERLAANDMRQLRERITQHFSLAPLKPLDVASYIEFRLRAAGYHGPNPFTEQAVKLIAELSVGLSRRINILADKALLASYSAGSHKVDVTEIRAAAQDARFSPLQQKSGFNRKPVLWSIAGAGLATILLTLAFSLGSHSGFLPPTVNSPTSPPSLTPNDLATKAGKNAKPGTLHAIAPPSSQWKTSALGHKPDNILHSTTNGSTLPHKNTTSFNYWPPMPVTLAKLKDSWPVPQRCSTQLNSAPIAPISQAVTVLVSSTATSRIAKPPLPPCKPCRNQSRQLSPFPAK